MLSLRVSRDKRGYDHIYLLLETRRKGRTVTRLLYGGRWPSPMKIGQQPLDEATRRTLEQAYPEVAFDWAALQRTLQQALATPRAPMTPETRRRRAEGRPPGPGGQGQSQGGPGGHGGRPQQGPGRVPPSSRPQQQMPPRQRPPYGPGAHAASSFGDRGGHRDDQRDDQREDQHDELRDELRRRSLDDTADLPYGAAGVVESDSDVDAAELTGRPYDEPILEEGLESEPRRGFSDMPPGPEEIVAVEERTFVVSSSGDDDVAEHGPAQDELVEDRFEPAQFERPDLPGPGFTRDEFPVNPPERADTESALAGPGAVTPGGAAADPSAPPRRRRRRRRGGRRSHGGANAAPQQEGGLSTEHAAEPDHADSEPDGPDGHDDDSDV